MDTESGQSLESGRQCRLTSDAVPSGLYMVDWGLQSNRLHNMHSSDMIPRLAAEGPTAALNFQLERLVKLQQPNQRNPRTRICG
jgi:hypothetical protein